MSHDNQPSHKKNPEDGEDEIEIEDEDFFDGYEGSATRSAEVMPPRSLDHIDVTSLSPSAGDAGEVRSTDLEFDPSLRPLDRSLMTMSLGFGAQSDFEPGSMPLNDYSSRTALSPRPDHSLAGLAVMDLPFYLRLEALTSSTIGPSSASSDLAAAVAVTSSLVDQEVDFKIQASIAEWSCALTSRGGARCTFTVRLWRKSAELVLESSRLSGDAHTFIQAHRSLLAFTTGAPPPARPAAPPFPPMPVLGLEDSMEQFVMSCKASIASGMLDAALEGAQVLAGLSADSGSRGILHRCEVVPVLVNFLKSEPSTVLQVGCDAELLTMVCLANLAEEPVAQSALLETGCVAMLLERVRDGNFEDRSMRREAARALRSLAADQAGADSIIRQVGKDRLTAWVETTFGEGLLDERMKADVVAVKDRIEERWVVVST
jgi:hypothetical protein